MLVAVVVLSKHSRRAKSRAHVTVPTRDFTGFAVTPKQQRATECASPLRAQLRANQRINYTARRGWEAECQMRVASLESALAAVTLITAIIVLLWEIKIVYGS